MKRLLFTFLLLSIGLGGICIQAKNNTKIVNPVLPGDRPDPSVIEINGEYWATATSNEWSPLFPIFKSKDLINWELVNYVFPEGAPDWALNNFWAPELSYDEAQKKVYVYYTARDKKSSRLSCAAAVADSPMGKFRDLGPLVAQEPGSIDAYATRDENGKLYLIWKEDGNSMGLPTHMWAQQMTEDRTRLVGEMTSLFYNDTPWEEGLVEGACVFRKNDYFYLLYSAASCCDKKCNYKTGVARSKSLLGKWEKYEKNPILIDNQDWRCSGHGTIVRKDNKEFYLYHAYNRSGSVYVGRQGVLEELCWGADGWPYFENRATYDRPNVSLDYIDSFKGASLNPIWQWRVTQDIHFQTGKDGLQLGASMENRELGTLLVQPIKALNFTLTATIDTKHSTSAVGIAIIGGANNGFGAPLAGIGIYAKRDGVEVQKIIDGKVTVLAQSAINVSEKAQIRMIVKDGHWLTFEYKSEKEWLPLSEKVDASPYVPWGMGFRIGLCAKGTDGTVANFRKIELTH